MNIIILIKRNRNNKRLLIIKNIDKIIILKISKILSFNNFNNKYNYIIKNNNIN